MDVEKLLQEILNVSIRFTNSDGASLFLVMPEPDPVTGEKMMRFEIMVNTTLGNRYEKNVMPVNSRSLAGYVISTGKNLNVFDAYNLPKNLPYEFDPTLDEKNNYKSKTMLIVPMIDHKSEIIGAIQLINRKKYLNTKLVSHETVDENVIEYDHKNELLIRSLGSQATVAIETLKLYTELQDTFEAFMEASMRAVDSRDPNTAGHSRRVGKLSVAIANHINLLNNGELSRYNFSNNEIRSIKYAGLLHDFGKLGIPERILLKDKKLYEEELANIETRLEILKYSENANRDKSDARDVIRNVENVRNAIIQANSHSNITGDISDKLNEARLTDIVLLDNSRRPVLTENECNRLIAQGGSLTREEFEIIKSHVEHTYKYLCSIKWPKGLERIPEISRLHHEKLDGSGYPFGLKGDEIPIESQILCISDIFDALTSKDRPYKKRVSVEEALEVLRSEAEKGRLNADIVNMMIESKIYHVIIDDMGNNMT
jgi:HD-GYP domain-containing protein (c-di-GMP phosphodiesterase class II)